MAIVTINISAYTEPPIYNEIEMSFSASNQVCYAEKSTYQVDSVGLEAGSSIYEIDNTPAEIGWYSDGTNRAQWDGTQIIAFEACQVLWEPSEPSCVQEEVVDYCVSWTALNEGNIKMSTTGEIDFTAMLAGRTIVGGGASVGTITGYIIAGMGTFACSVPMTFTASKAQWNTDTLPVEADKVLTSLIYSVSIIFNDATEFDIIDGQTNAIVTPDPQLSSSYNDC